MLRDSEKKKKTPKNSKIKIVGKKMLKDVYEKCHYEISCNVERYKVEVVELFMQIKCERGKTKFQNFHGPKLRELF